jgi:DNA-binding response OmpR family regulator
MRVLVVDDSRTAVYFLRTKLEEMGYEVAEAKTGAEAWAHLQKQPERLVITDWMMPDMDGLDLCRLIRSRGLVPYTYVIVLTTKDQREDRLKAFEAGADGFLPKPLDEHEFEVCLHTARRILGAQDAARTAAAAGLEIKPQAT